MIAEPRESWSKRKMTCPDRSTPYKLYAGAAVHWPGDRGLTLTGKPHAACQSALVGIENYQMDVSAEKYGAVAYQVVVCGPHGKVIEGRTRRKVNGANGDNSSNVKYGSILALIGMNDPVTDELLDGILAAARYLGVTKLLTHNQVRPQATACPGPALTKWIKAGYPDPGDDDMAVSDADVKKIADAAGKAAAKEVWATMMASLRPELLGKEYTAERFIQAINRDVAPKP